MFNMKKKEKKPDNAPMDKYLYRMSIEYEWGKRRRPIIQVDNFRIVYENSKSVVIEDTPNDRPFVIDKDMIFSTPWLSSFPSVPHSNHTHLIPWGGCEDTYFYDDPTSLDNWDDISIKILLYTELTSLCHSSGARGIYTPLTSAQIEGSCQQYILRIINIIECEPSIGLTFIEDIRKRVCGLPLYDIKDAVLLSLEKYKFHSGIIMKLQHSDGIELFKDFNPVPNTRGEI